MPRGERFQKTPIYAVLNYTRNGAIDGTRTRDNSDHNRELYQLSYDRHKSSSKEGRANQQKMGVFVKFNARQLMRDPMLREQMKQTSAASGVDLDKIAPEKPVL